MTKVKNVPLSLHTISSNKRAKKKRKRVGRGNSSGHGTYSGRGQKGQKSRSGVSGLKRLGLKKRLLQIPKIRGFKSHKPKNQAVNLEDINNNFKDGEKVNSKILLKKGLIGTMKLPIKILGRGELRVKGLQFRKMKISERAKEQIEKMGGEIGAKERE